MDFLPIVVLIVFVLLGGVIAVVADVIGRKIGKKRLKIHHRIRPKYTARILTFLWGVLITLFTMFLIGVSSSDMRTLLLHGRQAINLLRYQQAQLQLDNGKLKSENVGLADRNKDLATKLYEGQVRLKDADSKLKESQKKLADANKNLEAAASKYAMLSRREASLSKSLGSVNRELASKRTELAKAQKDYKAAHNQLVYAAKMYDDQVRYSQKMKADVDDLELKAKASRQQIDDANASISALNVQKAQLQSDTRIAQEAKDKALAALSEVQQQLRVAEQQVALTGQSLLDALERSRLRPLMFAIGEELFRLPIPAGTSKDKARSKVEDALAVARTVAKERGARQANGIDYADLKDNPEASVETQKDEEAAQLAGSPEGQVLIVYSSTNVFALEGVIVALSHKPNPIVYQQGQLLAEVPVDARADYSKILQSLNGLMTNLRKRAIQDKMIPIGNTSFGSVTSEQILDLYDRIRIEHRQVRVQALARQQTRAADPLVLNFEVK
ncbi:MAG: DUF3084 domain-containing protein [Fimbriimonadales bacterium]